MYSNATGSSGVFVWGHVFQRGDLPLFVTDLNYNPLSPYSVRYTIVTHMKGSQGVIRVGPEDRVPVQVGVGEYYATGVAGQCGQPGDWCVKWHIQEFFEGPIMEATYCFKVFDASQYCAQGGTSGTCPPMNTPACGCRRFCCTCTTAKVGW